MAEDVGRVAGVAEAAKPVAWRYRYPNYERNAMCEWTITTDGLLAEAIAHRDGEFQPLFTHPAPSPSEPDADAIATLRAELGSLRHKAAVATIGHEQLNEFIAIFDGLGFRGVHINEQVRRAAEELRSLRAELEVDVREVP
jgi:hypothetical protein